MPWTKSVKSVYLNQPDSNCLYRTTEFPHSFLSPPVESASFNASSYACAPFPPYVKGSHLASQVHSVRQCFLDCDFRSNKSLETQHSSYRQHRYGALSTVQDSFHLQLLISKGFFWLPQGCFYNSPNRLWFLNPWTGATQLLSPASESSIP